jgi:hypothetical protein
MTESLIVNQGNSTDWICATRFALRSGDKVVRTGSLEPGGTYVQFDSLCDAFAMFADEGQQWVDDRERANPSLMITSESFPVPAL